MKPFDLEAALQGEPVVLRNGKKAYIGMNLFDLGVLESTTSYPLQGVVLEEDDSDFTNESWTLEGLRVKCNETDPFSIVGMWEEPTPTPTPTPTVTVTLPKPFQPKKGEEYYFIRQNGFGSLYVDKKVRESIAFEYNAFRKEEDAQSWIDAMREAVYE